ncbi:transglycosylase SLT domain-containing protein [Nucisporomicrobium flavum]|uniref:transglycosylase SLT domain-containing protein n=1 Tax=Nucisporomicrobium flavum TaxID=2785915 RepID=UPI0018F50E9F|nr:transglycosylase SLT domain-containing protein [Nucisporomicrobium flavum]
MMGVDGVLSRITELQSQLGIAPATASTGTTSGASFATALADAGGSRAASSGSGVTGQAVVDAAKKYLGTPYVFGGTDPGKGLDCSALVQRAYKDLGIDLPRTSREQARAGTKVDSLAQAKPGDILAFDSPVDHVAIYLGDNKMIAAPKAGDHVKIQSVYETPTHIRRVLGTADAPAAAAVRPASLQNSSSLAGVPYADMFVRAGAKYGVSPKLLAAVAKVESGYDPKAVSKAGAQGLMQLMPATARGLGVHNSFDPQQAINGAAKLLSGHLKEFKSLPLVLAAYNAGGGNVHKYGGIPPFAETQAYVPKVQKALAALG